MKHRLLIILLAALCAIASASGQSIRTLGYNTTNGQVVYSGTNALTFTNANLNVGDFNFNGGLLSAYDTTFDFEQRQITDTNIGNVISWGSGTTLDFGLPINFGTNAATTRTNLSLGATWLTNGNVTNFRSAIGLPWSGLTNTNASGFRSALELSAGWLTNTNVTNFRTAIGLGASDSVNFQDVTANFATFNEDVFAAYVEWTSGSNSIQISPTSIVFVGGAAGSTRTNLGIPLPALANTSNVTMMRALSGSTNTSHPYSGSISVTGTNNTNTLVFSNGILQSVQ
jgi:hypothetical protein